MHDGAAIPAFGPDGTPYITTQQAAGIIGTVIGAIPGQFATRAEQSAQRAVQTSQGMQGLLESIQQQQAAFGPELEKLVDDARVERAQHEVVPVD